MGVSLGFMRHVLTFCPFPLLSSAHMQTAVAAHLPVADLPSQRQFVRLEDGDQIALELSTPPGWQAEHPTVVILHGLCGSHEGANLVRLASKIMAQGGRAVRMNMRGCGSGKGLARQPYHSGRSDDIFAALQTLHAEAPASPMTLVGFSLGGNQVLKLAGELGASVPNYLERVIAVCAPVDLHGCAAMLARPENRFYNRHFVRQLKADVLERQQFFPHLPRFDLPDKLTVYAFDDIYTAPQSGFASADDYYTQTGAAPFVPDITIPCHILFADDDPFIDATAFDGVRLPSNIEVYHTTHGGHLGFLGAPWQPGGFRWMDTQVLRWLGLSEAFLSQSERDGVAAIG